jgi:hypothetical protein
MSRRAQGGIGDREIFSGPRIVDCGVGYYS